MYNPGQFDVVTPFVINPQWLVLGGPADANEAQCATKIWPQIKIIASEPAPGMREWQLANGWPDGALLLPYALAEERGTAELHLPTDQRGASLMSDRPGVTTTVETISINALNKLHGPITQAVLWLDIEGYEYEALKGASDLFDAGEVLLVNVEILVRRTAVTRRLEQFFSARKFRLAHRWNEHGTHHDRIYVPQ